MKAQKRQDFGYDLLLNPPKTDISDIPFSEYVPPTSFATVEYVEVVEYVKDPEMQELYDYVVSLGKVPEKLGEESLEGVDYKDMDDGDKYIIMCQMMRDNSDGDVVETYANRMHKLLNRQSN